MNDSFEEATLINKSKIHVNAVGHNKAKQQQGRTFKIKLFTLRRKYYSKANVLPGTSKYRTPNLKNIVVSESLIPNPGMVLLLRGI